MELSILRDWVHVCAATDPKCDVAPRSHGTKCKISDRVEVERDKARARKPWPEVRFLIDQ